MTGFTETEWNAGIRHRKMGKESVLVGKAAPWEGETFWRWTVVADTVS